MSGDVDSREGNDGFRQKKPRPGEVSSPDSRLLLLNVRGSGGCRIAPQLKIVLVVMVSKRHDNAGDANSE